LRGLALCAHDSVRNGTRIRIAAFGFILLLAGVYRTTTGAYSWTNSRGLPIDAGLVIAIGLVVLLLAAIPNSWFERASKRRSPR